MFAQVIQGRTSNKEAVAAAGDRWMREVQPGSIGFLGSTQGVTDDGRFIVIARFESAEAAAQNGARPEQTAWWEETSKLFDDEPSFMDSEDVDLDLVGDPDRAGFVQVMQGRVSDPARARELMASMPQDAMKEFRPDVLGTVMITHDDGRWTQVIYFTSEAEARQNEQKEPPQEFQGVMDELMKLGVGEVDYLDLRQPTLLTPKES
jgi:hypothetical protein